MYYTYQFCGYCFLPAPESHPEGAVALGVCHAQVHPHLTQLVSNLLQLVTDRYQEESLVLRSPAKIKLSGKSPFFSTMQAQLMIGTRQYTRSCGQ